MGLASARTLCSSAAADALAPDPDLKVSDWADEYRKLSSKASAEAGEWRTSRTPYLREIMDAMSVSHPATDGDFMKGTQIGGSEAIYNAIGYFVDRAPGPLMLVMPTTDTGKRISRQRLQPMIDETPALAKRFSEAKSRNSANTVLMKDFAGGYLVVAGANSGPGLRSIPVRVLLMDEVDAYPDDVDGEGDPCAVAEKRTDTFSRAKRFTCSSPKIKGKSRIERRYQRGTRARYHVPCPHCAHEQWLRWDQMRWDMEQRRELVCRTCATVSELTADATPAACPHCHGPVDADQVVTKPTDDVADAWYECEACSNRIDEHHKTVMLERGRHIHEQPGVGEILADDDPHPHAIWARIGGQVRRFLPRFRRPLSWHVSALYSPLGWFSWRKAAQQFVEADKGGFVEETGESLMQVFANTVLGEAYEIAGEQPKDAVLKLRAEPYQLGQVPAGGLLLTAGVDVQGDRLEIKVKAYGRGQESWLVDYQRIYYPVGATKPTADTWEQLIALRDKAYPHAGGATVRIAAMAIDSGYLTADVYDFARKWARKHIIATKGVSGRGKPLLGLPTATEVSHQGRKIKTGGKVWPMGVDTAKEQVYKQLEIAEPGPGYMHFPAGLPDEYYEGLTAEKLVRKRRRGVDTIEWVKVRDRNEPLDLEVMCRAAAQFAGVQRVNWDALESVINPGQRDLFAAAPGAAYTVSAAPPARGAAPGGSTSAANTGAAAPDVAPEEATVGAAAPAVVDSTAAPPPPAVARPIPRPAPRGPDRFRKPNFVMGWRA